MYYEYKNFISKRVQFLVEGDLDTQLQTNYTGYQPTISIFKKNNPPALLTVLVENLPTNLRSTPMLTDFFERLYPGG